MNEDVGSLIRQINDLKQQLGRLESVARQVWVTPPTLPDVPKKNSTLIVTKSAHGRSVGDPVNADGTLTVYVTDDYIGVVWKILDADTMLVVTEGYIDGLSFPFPWVAEIRNPYISYGSPTPATYATQTLVYMVGISATEGMVTHYLRYGDLLDHPSQKASYINIGSPVDASSWVDGDIINTDGSLSVSNDGKTVAGSYFTQTSSGETGSNKYRFAVQTIYNNVNYIDSAPAKGDVLYLTATPGKVSATRPTTPAYPIGRAAAVGSAGKVAAVLCFNWADALSSVPNGIVPIANGGTGRDMTSNPVNGVVFKYDATTFGEVINAGNYGVLTQVASGTPVFHVLDTNSFRNASSTIYSLISGKDSGTTTPTDKQFLRYTTVSGKWDAYGPLLTAKGGILSRSTTDLVELTVGTNGQVLTADSAQTSGLKWADISAPLTPATDSGYETVATTSTWGDGDRIVTFILVGGGGGGGGGATTATTIQNSTATIRNGGGGGAGGEIRIFNILMYDGYTMTVSNGGGGNGGGAGLPGSAGTDTSVEIKDSGGTTLVNITAHGGNGGYQGTTSAPGKGGSIDQTSSYTVPIGANGMSGYNGNNPGSVPGGGVLSLAGAGSNSYGRGGIGGDYNSSGGNGGAGRVMFI